MKIIFQPDSKVICRESLAPLSIIGACVATFSLLAAFLICYLAPVVVSLECDKSKDKCIVTRKYLTAPDNQVSFKPDSFVKAYRDIHRDPAGQISCNITLKLKKRDISFLDCNASDEIDPIIYKLKNYFNDPERQKFFHQQDSTNSAMVAACVLFIAGLFLLVNFIIKYRVVKIVFLLGTDYFEVIEKRLHTMKKITGTISDIRNIKVEKDQKYSSLSNSEGLFVVITSKSGAPVEVLLNSSADKEIHKEIKKLKKVILNSPEK